VTCVPTRLAGATVLHPTADAIRDSPTGGQRECAEAVTIEAVVTVRRAEADDADAVLALMEELGRPAVAADPSTQRAVFLVHLEREDAAVFVAESDARIVGAASFWVRPRLNWTSPEAWIPDLIVSSPHRRRGAARRLLDACAAEARARGCHVLRLESGPQRAAAHRLYEAYGFRHFARAYELPL
jgi:ribosomal protein S18 acetylase RimI-like enzyme